MMRWLFVVLVCLAFLAGCGTSQGLPGKWTAGQEIELELTDAGKYALKGNYQGAKYTSNGAWTYEGTKLTLKPEKVEILSIPNNDDRPGYMRALKEEQVLDLSWRDNNRFSTAGTEWKRISR